MVGTDVTFGHFREEDCRSLWKPAGDDDNVAATLRALGALDQAIYKESQAAVRFVLEAGDVLVIDNYRVLHAREAYADRGAVDGAPDGSERRTWRVWSWTTDSHGLPPSVTGAAPSTVRKAERLIAESDRLAAAAAAEVVH